MSGKTKSPGNILINPADYSSRLAQLEVDKDSKEIARLENHLAHRPRLGGAITCLDEDGKHVIEDRDGIHPFSDGNIPQALS